MTPTPPELSPEQEAEVRALLSGAREAGPVPEEVLARLEDTLADLRREALPTGPVAPVVPIASRRRRTLAAALVAAAAVVVGGVGIGQVLPGSGGGGDAMVAVEDGAEDSVAGDGAGAAERSAGASAEAPADPSADRDGVLQDQSEGEGSRGPAPEVATSAKQKAYALRSDTLDRDVRTLRRTERRTELTNGSLGAVCAVPDAGSGRRIAVTLDEIPALLVLRSPDGDRQRGDIYLCGAAEIEHTVWLPAN